LSNTKVLVLDEATAHVDPNSDRLLQTMLSTHFNDCTVIKIAHRYMSEIDCCVGRHSHSLSSRLEDVANCDEVIVMDHGQIKEKSSPKTLLQVHAERFSRPANSHFK
jgi:ATP-binding cassette subfamily C (CFTR/MRP) protein 4